MDLSQLQQKINNYTTVVSSWLRNVGKLYFDSTPQDVSVELLDDNGNVTTTTMPNLAKTRADFEAWKNDAQDRMPFLNLLKNPHMQDKDANGNYINLPFLFYEVDLSSWRIVDSSTQDVPQIVKDYIAQGIQFGHGNVLEVHFTHKNGYNIWLAGNSVRGTFSGGWKWVYVAQGQLRHITAGQVGSFFDVHYNWNFNIDLSFGDFADNSIVYFAHPFVVAGEITNVSQVKTINYTTHLNY